MKTIKKQTRPTGEAERRRLLHEIREDAAQLASVPAGAWAVVLKRLGVAQDDATEESQEKETTAEDRQWLTGGAWHLRNVRTQLADLHSGAYKQWPEFPQDSPAKAKEGDEDGPDAHD